MKRRMLSFVLVIALLLSVTLPANAATAKQAYQFLVDCAKQGSYNAQEKLFQNNYSMGQAGNLRVSYYEQSKKVVLYTRSASYLSAAFLELESSLNTPYNGSFANYFEFDYNVESGPRINVKINPATYSENTNLVPNQGADASSYNSLMAKLVELLNLLLYTGGYSIKDLGFTKFTQHFYHIAGNSAVTVPPTCGTPGVRTTYCGICGVPVKEERIPPTEAHILQLDLVIEPPTCTEAGWIIYKCTVCGEAVQDTPPALGHAWTLTELLTEPGEEGTHSARALYTCSRCNETKEGRLCAGEVFKDMPPEGFWSHDPIDWAWLNGITGGTGPDTFSPDLTVTRSQVVTFLWAAAEKPAPESTTSPFTDVKEGDWFLSPVLWAVENGITGGVGNNQFGPGAVCTRSQIVTFLWAAAGKPEPEMTESPFTDVREGDWYRNAVLWAVENGVTGGVGNNQFGPDLVCTRAQAVTFLYKASQIPAPEEPAEP